MPTKLSQLPAADPATAAAGVALWTGKDAISGLILEYVSANSLRVTPGAAVIESLGYLVPVTAAITKSGLSLSANTWYHVYLYMNSGVPDIEIVTTAPAAAYFGTARSKTSDTSRRYLGSVKTNGSSQLVPFLIDSLNEFRWLVANPTFRALANGGAGVRTTVSLAAGMPVTATHAILQTTNTATVYANITATGAAAVSMIGLGGIVPGQVEAAQVITFPAVGQSIDYSYGAAQTNGLYIDVIGFSVSR